MSQNKEVLLKSLHVCLRLPILIFDKEFNLVEEYRSNRTISFFYNYKLLLKRIVNDRDFFYYINGNFNEMFLLYVNGERNYLFGPFKCNIIDKEFFQLK
ncbi:YSIRK-targeted surface antigen transcriptional regulator, partial [Enterococcus faecalis]|nr:YSIRK-targeted surface antigen transcriptional regulator [Enterococcus faecalis]